MSDSRASAQPEPAGNPDEAPDTPALLGGGGLLWHGLRLKDLYRSGKEFELTSRAMGFAALAMLTVFPLLVLVAAVSAAAHHGLAVWVTYGMGLRGLLRQRCQAAVLRARPRPGHH